MQTIEPQIDRYNQKLHRTFLLQQIFQGIMAGYALLHLYYEPSHVKIVSLLELSGWFRMSQKHRGFLTIRSTGSPYNLLRITLYLTKIEFGARYVSCSVFTNKII